MISRAPIPQVPEALAGAQWHCRTRNGRAAVHAKYRSANKPRPRRAGHNPGSFAWLWMVAPSSLSIRAYSDGGEHSRSIN